MVGWKKSVRSHSKFRIEMLEKTLGINNGPLIRYVKLRVAHAPGMPGTFSPLSNSMETVVSDPGMHHGTCVTHVPWCMSRSLTRGGGENVPGIPGAWATRNFAYLARGPWSKKVQVNSLAPVRRGCNFQTQIKNTNLLWNCSQSNATKPCWSLANVSSGNGVMPSGNKPLPEPMLTQFYGAIWRH